MTIGVVPAASIVQPVNNVLWWFDRGNHELFKVDVNLENMDGLQEREGEKS